jgi:hypothetical protein
MPATEYESQLILAKIVKALKVLDDKGVIIIMRNNLIY